ncbi:MAG: rhomboid family intramembrane serine protease [Bacteroidales bacterium]|jgi:membrane associated rhomboid family serine protease|nr:rhomboid family intramembrane serine protease [Bacteroidales bacterium]
MTAREVKQLFNSSDVLTQLIVVNVAMFALYHVVHLFFYLFAATGNFTLYSWLAAPTDLSLLLKRPWTVLTYMFFHKDILHILFNMLLLFWFGRIFRIYFDKNVLFNVFVLGGFSGVFLYIASYNIFPVFAAEKYFSSIIGASAGVLAVAVGIACYVPAYRINLLFFGSVKLIYIAGIYILTDIVSISMHENTGGHIAHLGGALFGYLFALNMRKNKDITLKFTQFRRWCINLFFPRPKLKVGYKRPPVNDWDYNKQKRDNQSEIDRILDKISKGGYDSLTKREKETLFDRKN